VQIHTRRTISEVHVNVISSDIRSHGDDGDVRSNLSYKDSCGNTVQVRHDDIHQNQIELIVACVNLIHGFKSVALDGISNV
jgi:hypothetical protein